MEQKKRLKLRQFTIYKLSIERLTEKDEKEIKIVPITMTKREALENGELVKIQSNQLTNKILEYCDENSIPCSDDLTDYLVNLVVPTEAKKRGEKEYAAIAKGGFTLNDKRYTRIFSGSGQIRKNTVTFIREDLYEPIFSSLLCGLTLEDFGQDFNAAKFNAYAGLNMTGCHLLPESLTPKVCIVDDFEQIRPHNTVNYVTERSVQYITLPDEDYVLDDNQNEFSIVKKKAIRKSDGAEFKLHKGVKKSVQEISYDEIEDSPPLNSFDGQGMMSPTWADRISTYLKLGYIPSEMIIRAPWLKGMVCCVPFHEWFAERGITEITDSFGKVRKIADIDVLISKSQFKMWKIYKAKCEPMGINAWDYYCSAMEENRLRWGIAKVNNQVDDDYKALNYQYLQALQLNNEDIDKLCEPTRDFLERLNSGDIEEVYNNLMIIAKSYKQDVPDDENDIEEFIANENYTKLFQKVLEVNPTFIDDKYIRELILRECQVKFDAAKLGKIISRGNFQFCVSDPIAQLEWIGKNHCGMDIDIVGVIPAGEVYSNYWLQAEDCVDEIVLMRSPLIDRNEISKRKLIKHYEHYFRYLSSGIIYSVHDLTALAMSGMDFDGDLCYSSNNPIILKGCYDYATARPLYYRLQSTDLVGAVTPENIIAADVRGLNSKIGQIANKAGSFYAKLQNYTEGTPEYENIYNSIIFLGQVTGQEIDRIKTAIKPTEPLEWKTLQPDKRVKCTDNGFEDLHFSTEEEEQGICRHNELSPGDKPPYYFRYNYSYIDEKLRKLNKDFNGHCKDALDCKLDTFLQANRNGCVSDEEQIQLYKRYVNIYPLIDNDCIVNHICHHFENFEKALKKTTRSGGRNMLSDYTSMEQATDDDTLSKTDDIINRYRKLRGTITRDTNTNKKNNNKDKSHSSYERHKMVTAHYRDEMLDLTGGNIQRALDYLMAVSEDEKTVWNILDESILRIIRKDTRC